MTGERYDNLVTGASSDMLAMINLMWSSRRAGQRERRPRPVR
jgi:hypothetical protein